MLEPKWRWIRIDVGAEMEMDPYRCLSRNGYGSVQMLEPKWRWIRIDDRAEVEMDPYRCWS